MSGVFASHRAAGGYKPSMLAPSMSRTTALALAHKYKAKQRLRKDKTYVVEQHREGDESTPTGGVLAMLRQEKQALADALVTLLSPPSKHTTLLSFRRWLTRRTSTSSRW